MLNTLTKEEVEKYSKLLSLPQKTTEELGMGKICFEKISDAFMDDAGRTLQRLNDLDCYLDDHDVEQLEESDSVFLLSPKGLAGDGLIMSDEKGDIGYCLLYPVSHESDKDLPEGLKKTRERSGWNGIAEYLTEISREKTKIVEKDLYHHFDYAIKREDARRCGLGRLILRYALDECLPDGCIAIGFIDYRTHTDSLVSATKAGCILGKEVYSSPDGDHPAILEIFSKKISYHFTGEEINLSHSRDGIENFPIAVKEIVNRDFPKNCLAFNFEREKLCSVEIDRII